MLPVTGGGIMVEKVNSTSLWFTDKLMVMMGESTLEGLVL